MKTKFGIVGCGFLGGIVADAYRKGLLPDYEHRHQGNRGF